MPQEDDPYLDTAQVGARIGVSADSIRLYLKRTRRRISDGLKKRPQDLPLPDSQFRRSPVWRESTINAWIASRPGRGRRGPDE
ncbi:helix-turn-helix transcriptional regulator [Streptomyces sp. IBSBF 2950]|uniref:helix-turn-helix transcriptional regulator n=1 Tax=Streptomyces sp. IBSBF 2950 TaxID=2903528 RepID=UPI002FDC4BCC